MKRWYDVNGLSLCIRAPDADLITFLDAYVKPFACPEAGAPDYVISLERARIDEPPVEAETLFEGELVPGTPCRLSMNGEQTWLVVTDQISVATDQKARTTTIQVDIGCLRANAVMAGIHALDAAIAAAGQYLLHGAALALPGDDTRAILLFAPSGTGKTTTALTLGLGGFGLMTDDAIVLQPRGYGGDATNRAWGLPRALKVHRRTVDLLPQIAPLLDSEWDSDGEQVLSVERLAGMVRTLPPRPIAIAAIVVLAERTTTNHHIAPMPKAEAMMRLVDDNVACAPSGVPAKDIKRFQVIGALVAAVQVFKLRVGEPLATLPEMVARRVSHSAAH